MKLLRIDNFSYSILYVEEDGEYYVYRRLKENDWYVNKKDWVRVTSKEKIQKLEKLYKDENSSIG